MTDYRDMISERAKPPAAERNCKHCGKPFVPLQGAGRLHCYDPECEVDRERERRLAVKTRARMRKREYRRKKKEERNGGHG